MKQVVDVTNHSVFYADPSWTYRKLQECAARKLPNTLTLSFSESKSLGGAVKAGKYGQPEGTFSFSDTVYWHLTSPFNKAKDCCLNVTNAGCDWTEFKWSQMCNMESMLCKKVFNHNLKYYLPQILHWSFSSSWCLGKLLFTQKIRLDLSYVDHVELGFLATHKETQTCTGENSFSAEFRQELHPSLLPCKRAELQKCAIEPCSICFTVSGDNCCKCVIFEKE